MKLSAADYFKVKMTVLDALLEYDKKAYESMANIRNSFGDNNDYEKFFGSYETIKTFIETRYPDVDTVLNEHGFEF